MELRNRRRLAGELVLGALPFAGAFACMAMCVPADAAPDPGPVELRTITVFSWDECRGCDMFQPEAWVLVTADHITVGTTGIDPPSSFYDAFPRDLPLGRSELDLEGDLEYLHATLFADRADIEIAAASTDAKPVSYQELVTAMAIARRAGFSDIILR